MSAEIIPNLPKRREASRIAKIATVAGGLIRHLLNSDSTSSYWDNRLEACDDEAQAKWISDRVVALSPFLDRGTAPLARAQLELFCAGQSGLPSRGLPLCTLRMAGFWFLEHNASWRAETPPITPARFPEGWQLVPVQPITTLDVAELVDPSGTPVYTVTYREGQFGDVRNASITAGPHNRINAITT